MAQVVIVTGGAGGIGSAVCRALAKDGLNVAIADFNTDAAIQLADEICKEGGEALAIQADVGEKASVNSMAEKVIERYGKIDFLLNGAGVRTIAPSHSSVQRFYLTYASTSPIEANSYSDNSLNLPKQPKYFKPQRSAC